MPRALTLGNGDLLINFDGNYNLVDIYWPYVGRENQTDGHVCRMGVWADGRFAWVEDAPVPADAVRRLKTSLDEVVPNSHTR